MASLSSFIFLLALLSPTVLSSRDYDYWCTGNCGNPVNTTPHAGIILMGGGTDVDDAFKQVFLYPATDFRLVFWNCAQQHIAWSSCGDFLVLRTSGTDAYNSYIAGLGCSNSVSTLLIKNEQGANDDFVVSTIQASEAIFFAGGDQSSYLQLWQNSRLQAAVQEAVSTRNVPVGGTSAGCDIQSYYIYSASNGSVYSDEALENPYNKYMTFSDYFLEQLQHELLDSIVDTHFVTRDRFGRLFAFVGRLRTDHNGANIRGIGINEQTAIAIDLETQVGTLLGPTLQSEAYIILPDHQPAVCQPNTPLTFENVTVQKLTAKAGDVFDFKAWTGGRASERYTVSAVRGRMKGDPYHA